MNKKIIQNAHYTTGKKLLFITLIFLFSLVFYNKTFATFIPIYGNRTYTIYDQSGNATSQSTNGICGGNVQGCVVPFDIISDRPSGSSSIDLNRFTLEWQFTGFDNNSRYNSARILIAIKQNLYNNYSSITDTPQSGYLYYTASSGNETVNCPITYRNAGQITYECNINQYYYDPPINASFIAGASVYTSRIGFIGVKPSLFNYNPIRLVGAEYTTTSSQDPVIAQQNTIIDQNTRIISNTERIADQNQEVQDKAINESQRGYQGADNAEISNTQASQNIFQLIGKVVGVFQNAPNGNCVIPVVASGVDLGNIDLCSGKPPIWGQLVGGVISILLVYACFRTALFIFQWFISLTAFAQGGGWNKGGNE